MSEQATVRLPPQPPDMEPNNPRSILMKRVGNALRALPSHFASTTSIEGLSATDLFALNTLLGATIEVEVVKTLNRIRHVWDPEDEWSLYGFHRQAQTFPDVILLRDTGSKRDIALGVELKGWYILAKEGVPSFRYRVTPEACTDWDLLAVVPWHLSNVLSGTPRVLTPGCWSAKYAAEYRNYWWQHIRDSRTDRSIISPLSAAPYTGRDNNSDKPVADSGNNFGRIARIGILDRWIEEVSKEQLAGIPARDWIKFLQQYKDRR